MVWLEFDKDPRWDKRVYSIIKILDTKEKKIISKSKKTHFSSVDISKNGEKLVALSNNPNGTQSLVFLNVEGCVKTNEINLPSKPITGSTITLPPSFSIFFVSLITSSTSKHR